MSYEKPKTVKVAGSVTVPINEQIDHYAGLAGMTKTQFLGVVMQLGLQAWIRSYAPEKLLTPDDWAKIVKLGDEEKN
jgi:ribosomal protein L30E